MTRKKKRDRIVKYWVFGKNDQPYHFFADSMRSLKDVQFLGQVFEYRRFELETTIGDDIFWNAITYKPMVD